MGSASSGWIGEVVGCWRWCCARVGCRDGEVEFLGRASDETPLMDWTGVDAELQGLDCVIGWRVPVSTFISQAHLHAAKYFSTLRILGQGRISGHNLKQKTIKIRQNQCSLNTCLNHSRGLLRLLLLRRRFGTVLRCRGRRSLERLLKVGDDVVNVLRSDRDADEVLQGIPLAPASTHANSPVTTYLAHTRADLLLVRQLLVRRGPRVDRQRLGVTNIGEVGNQLEAIDDLAAGRAAALYAKAQHAAKAALEVLLGRRVGRVALETRVRHPRDVGALLEVLGEGDGVLRVPLGAQRQGLEAEQELVRAKGVQAGTEVAEDLDADADGEGDGTEGFPELEAVVAFRGLDHLGEPVGVLAPVELAAVDDDAGDGGAVPADPLGGRVDYNVGAVLDRADKVAASAKGVVNLETVSDCTPSSLSLSTYDNRDALLVRHLDDGLKVRDVVARVADALNVNGLGLVVDGGGNVVGAVAVDELGRNAVPREQHLELVVGAAIQVGRRHDVVARVRERRDGDELRGLAGRCGHSRDAALKRGDSLLEDVDGGAVNRVVSI